MNSQWSENLRTRMDAHQEPLPEGLWEGIEQAMAEEPAVVPAKRRVRMLRTVYAGAAAAVLVVAVLVGGLLLRPASKDLRAVQTRGNEKSFSGQPVDGGIVTAVQPADTRQSATVKTVFEAAPGRMLAAVTAQPVAKDSVFSPKNGDEIASVPAGERQCREKTGREGDHRSGRQRKLQPAIQSDKRLPEPAHTDVSGWEAGLYASNFSSSSKNEHDGYGSLVDSESPDYTPENESHSDDEAYKTILFENKQRDVSTRLHHRQPVSIGFSVQYRLNERLSVGSGLSWIQLSSDMRTGSEKFYFSTEQTLVNLGIPLTINYNVFGSSRWSLYLSEGVQVEKTLSAKSVEQSVVDEVPGPEMVTRFSNKGLQWSVNSAIGLQYQLGKAIGLYAEPGFSYYFDNDSPVETIYKDKPFNFSLRMGLRWSLGL